MSISTCCASASVTKSDRLRTGGRAIADAESACIINVAVLSIVVPGPPLQPLSARFFIICKNHYSNPGTLYGDTAVQHPWTRIHYLALHYINIQEQ